MRWTPGSEQEREEKEAQLASGDDLACKSYNLQGAVISKLKFVMYSSALVIRTV